RNARPRPDDTDDDGKGGQRVGPGVLPLGDQRRGADPPAGTDAVDSDDLVAGRAHEGGGEHPPQVGHVALGAEGTDRLPHDESRRQRDDEPDEESYEVLGPAEAVAVAPGRGTPAEPEGDDERDGRRKVAEV